jgi:hypothetical protein
LASQNASFITGTVMRVDGGQTQAVWFVQYPASFEASGRIYDQPNYFGWS